MKLYDLSRAIDAGDTIVAECLEFLLNKGGKDVPLGRHDLNEKGIFMCVSEYTTRLVENAIWEAHKDYIDLHLLLQGEEYIHVSDLKNMRHGEYVKEKDFLPCEGEIDVSVLIDNTKALLLMPEDVHRPSVCVGDVPAKVKKVIFKIPVGCLVK